MHEPRWAVVSDEARAVLTSGAFAHVATVMPDGAPHVAPVWIDCRGDEITFIKKASSVAARNLDRDDRVAISVTAPDDPYCVVGLRGLVVDRRRGAPAAQWLQATARRYTGEGYPDDGDGILMVVKPLRLWLRRY